MCPPELAAPAHAVVQAVSGLQHGVHAVVTVPVDDVEAEALLAAPLLRHESISMIVGQAVLLFQAAQREHSVDWLEDDGSDHLRSTAGGRNETKTRSIKQDMLDFCYNSLRWDKIYHQTEPALLYCVLFRKQ